MATTMRHSRAQDMDAAGLSNMGGVSGSSVLGCRLTWTGAEPRVPPKIN